MWEKKPTPYANTTQYIQTLQETGGQGSQYEKILYMTLLWIFFFFLFFLFEEVWQDKFMIEFHGNFYIVVKEFFVKIYPLYR